jgi:hypothetical protein
MSQPDIMTTRPEWTEISFESGDWKIIYHGEALIGVDSPSYAMAQVLWYLGSPDYQQNPALGQAQFTAPEDDLEDESPNFNLFGKYSDSGAPETLSQEEYKNLVAAVTPTKF